MDYAIRLQNVNKRYQLGLLRAGSLGGVLRTALGRRELSDKADFYALRDVSFDVAPGESVGLVGANGAGKSTTLRLIAGIAQATDGQVLTNGRIATLLELGAGFHPELTGRENVFLYGSILGLKRREIKQQFDSIVDFSEIEQFIDTPLKRYSSGMYVRLAFSVAAHINPDILLVDEVLAVGDAAFRQKCMDRMTALLKDGTTLLFVSHSAEMVRRVCKRALYFAHGELVADGETDEIMTRYEADLRRTASMHVRQNGKNDQKGVSDAGVEITHIAVTNMNGIVQEEFAHDEKARIEVHYRSSTPLKSPVLQMRLFRDDDLACFTVRSTQKNVAVDGILLPNTGRFTLNIDELQLYGGTYRVLVAIADPQAVYARRYSDWFQVNGPGNVDIAHERLGVYVPKCDWDITPNHGLGISDSPVEEHQKISSD